MIVRPITAMSSAAKTMIGTRTTCEPRLVFSILVFVFSLHQFRFQKSSAMTG